MVTLLACRADVDGEMKAMAPVEKVRTGAKLREWPVAT